MPGPSRDTPRPPKAVEDKEVPHTLFSEFQRLCEDLEGEPSYNAKTKLVEEFLEKGKKRRERGGERSITKHWGGGGGGALIKFISTMYNALSLCIHVDVSQCTVVGPSIARKRGSEREME